MLAFIRRRRKREKERNFWVHPIFSVRKTEGEFHTLFPRLLRHPDKFHEYFRMPRKLFFFLESLLKERYIFLPLNILVQYLITRLTKCAPREPISSTERLSLCLRFLATGNGYRSMAFSRISDSTIGIIVRETCAAIYEILKPIYLRVPNSREEWKKIAADFATRWQVPMCLGCQK